MSDKSRDRVPIDAQGIDAPLSRAAIAPSSVRVIGNSLRLRAWKPQH